MFLGCAERGHQQSGAGQDKQDTQGSQAKRFDHFDAHDAAIPERGCYSGICRKAISECIKKMRSYRRSDAANHRCCRAPRFHSLGTKIHKST
jgi:hypothetical protein